MSHALNLLNSAYRAVMGMRQGGSTFALGFLANELKIKSESPGNDRWRPLLVVTATAAHGDSLKKQLKHAPLTTVSLEQAGNYVEGRHPQPFVFDNHAVSTLCMVAIDKIKGLGETIQAQQQDMIATEKKHMEQARSLTATIAGRNLQLQAANDEILKLKVRLSVRKVTTIQVRRRR